MKKSISLTAIATAAIAFVSSAIADVVPVSAVSASAYVQRGLVAHFDAIDNEGTGVHNPSASVWKNLVAGGSALDMTLTSYGVWRDKALTTSNSSKISARGTSPDAVPAMMEMFYTLPSYGNSNLALYDTGCASGANFASLFVLLDKNRGFLFNVGKMWPCGTNYSGTHSIVWYGNSGSAVYDGVSLVGNGSNYVGTNGRSPGEAKVGGLVDGAYCCGVKAHAIRLYSVELTDAEREWNMLLDKLRFKYSPNEMRMTVDGVVSNFEYLVRFNSSDSVKGTVSATVSETAITSPNWTRVGQTVTLTPVPASGYRFFGWTGDTAGLVPDANGVVTFTADRPRSLVCRFIDYSYALTPRTWTGNGGDGLWSTPDNWDSSTLPAVGDAVTIPAGAKVAITESTAKVGTLEVLGTISNRTWNAALNASIVTVKNGGVLTCGNAFTDEANATRVNLVCDELTVEKGGSINADSRGWKGGNNSGHACGYGPGAIPISDRWAGGGHGGIGSYVASIAESVLKAVATNEYGSASAPVTAGSGGWGGNGSGGNGGGVVTIAASGCVSVYGTISANGAGSGGGNASAGGAGGSVYITAKTFCGANGVVRANGGKASESYSANYHSGGGGRVAIVFDKAEQAKLACPKGMYYGADTGGFVAPDGGNFTECLPGSLYFSSDTLIDRNGATLFGKLDFADVTTKWTVDSVCLTNGWVMMARDDVEVEVTGDLEITGDTLVTRRYNATTKVSTDATRGTRWDVGGATLYFATNSLGVYRMASSAPKLTVGGDLKLNHYGLLYVYASQNALDPAATTPATTNLGARVAVAGKLDLRNIGKMYVKSHPRTGVSPVFSAGSMMVDASSWIDANNAGFFGGNTATYNSTCTRGLAPTNPGGKRGAGHGGKGGWGRNDSSTPGAAAYDSLDWPVLCGGGGNSDYQGNWPGQGGGVLRFFVTGEVRVDGKMRANCSSVGSFSGAGAGGTVLIECGRLVGEGDVQAKGSDGYTYPTDKSKSSGHHGGAGGGGRIAIHYDQAAQSNVTCGVTLSAAGGVGVGDGVLTGSGEAGTIWFPDDTIVADGKTHSGSLYVPELINFIRRDSLEIDNAVTEFAPGGYVEITHDLIIRGASAGTAGFVIPQGHFRVGGNLIIEKGHIEVSGDAAKPRTDIFRVGGQAILNDALITIECSDEDRDQVVSFGGNVVMTNGTTITLKSPCNAVEGEPGLVFTAPKLEMFKDCWVYPWSHPTNGASCLFRIPEIHCVSNSGFNANAKGYGRLTGVSGRNYGPRTTPTNGVGSEVKDANADSTVGPGHGGDGGSAKPISETNPRGIGLAFDERKCPIFAGPGGTGGYQSNVPPRGGGVVRVESTVFDLGGGTLTANGGGDVGFRSGGAGGSIYVRTDKFFGGNGFLYAKGGQGGYYNFAQQISNHKSHCMQGGGGGRIAIHFINNPSIATNLTVSAAGGNCPLDVPYCIEHFSEDLTALKAARDGKDGTVFFNHKSGTMLIMR